MATKISSRDIVDLLKDRILELHSSSVVLDFSDVQFISRSAAHELLLIKETFRLSNKELIFENANADVTEMLRIVAANRALPKSEKPEFNAERIDINTFLKEIRV